MSINFISYRFPINYAYKSQLDINVFGHYPSIAFDSGSFRRHQKVLIILHLFRFYLIAREIKLGICLEDKPPKYERIMLLYRMVRGSVESIIANSAFNRRKCLQGLVEKHDRKHKTNGIQKNPFLIANKCEYT